MLSERRMPLIMILYRISNGYIRASHNTSCEPVVKRCNGKGFLLHIAGGQKELICLEEGGLVERMYAARHVSEAASTCACAA